MKPYSYGVVVLSYNHPELTAKTLSSVLNLGYPASQIVLVHNGSSAQHTQNLRVAFPEIQHLVLHENQGYTGGANHGLKKCFEIFSDALFLTNDIELTQLPTHLKTKFDVCAPLIWKRNSTQIDSVLGSLNIKTGSLQHLKSFQDVKHDWIYVPGTAFTIKKKCFEDLQGFDESFHTYWEDVDLGIRAHKKGFTLGHHDEVQLRHKIGKTCHKDRFYTLYLFQRNRRRLMKKHDWQSPSFLWAYSKDMLKLFLRICFKPNPQVPLRLWWKAIYDK